MRILLKTGIAVTIISLVVSCGRKEKRDDDGSGAPEDDEVTDETDPSDGETKIAVNADVASGCTGEENVAMLLNATGLTLAKLTQQKQNVILQTQGRLPGDRSLELSTASHVTNKLNLTAEVGEVFANAWDGDEASPEYAAISQLYGAFPSGDRLAFIMFGKSFYERVYGGTADGEAVAAIGEMLDSLDEATTNPANNAPVGPVNDRGKVVALVTAIGSVMCIN